MGSQTSYLGLEKPDADDFYDVSVTNKNMAKIDQELETENRRTLDIYKQLKEQNEYIKTLEQKLTSATSKNVIYGFHIDGEDPRHIPDKMVTYLADAVGMTPAKMDYKNDKFDYGSWKDAFFMPRPCMLKYDGTVDYYLDEDDYTKIPYSSTKSDISNLEYEGNAMMEWGRDGRLIWIKVVPDANPISGSVYIADYQVDETYHAWSFVNAKGKLSNHFYTPIYRPCVDTEGRLRSMSVDKRKTMTVSEEITAAELNNVDDKKIWYTETLSDIMLLKFLLILISKTTDLREMFGDIDTGSKITNGEFNAKGLFYGMDKDLTDEYSSVKAFGMERIWGGEKRYAGHILDHGVQKIKMTCADNDGATGGYDLEGTNYIDIEVPLESTERISYITEMEFNEYGMFVKKAEKDVSNYRYYCSELMADATKKAYAAVSGEGSIFATNLTDEISSYNGNSGISCRPY